MDPQIYDPIDKITGVIPIPIISGVAQTPVHRQDANGDYANIGIKIIAETSLFIDNTHFIRREGAILLGKILYNTYKPDLEEGFNVWKSYIVYFNKLVSSSVNGTYSSFLPSECDKMFDEFGSNNPYTFKTFVYMAKMDNPSKYAEWHGNFLIPYMELAISCLHTYVARALYWTYFLNYCCTSLKRDSWMKYEGNYWETMEGGVDLLNQMTNHFYKLFELLRRRTRVRIEKLAFPDDIKSHDNNPDEQINKLKLVDIKITNLLDKLMTFEFKQKILREAAILFHNPDFDNFKNKILNLTALKNGVLETDSQSCIFRGGFPEEYITKYVPIFFPTGTTEEHPSVIFIFNWLHQCYAQVDINQDGKPVYNPKKTKSVVRYVLKIWASILRGTNSEKLFIVLTGVGNNSKSMIKKLHKIIFGTLCQDLDLASVKGGSSKGGGGANPALAKLDGVKEAWLSEPGNEENLSDSLIKLITGGDSFFARTLYSEGKDIQATCMLFLMCNKIPSIPSSQAMKNRMRVIQHNGVWSSNAPESEEEQFNQRVFKIDPDFEDKLKLLAPYFLWILSKMFTAYRREGLEEPKEITEATENYWAENDPYRLFITSTFRSAVIPGSITKENLNGIIDSKASVNKEEAYTVFLQWYRNNFPGQVLPKRSTLIYELENRIGKTAANDSWYGVLLINSEKSFK